MRFLPLLLLAGCAELPTFARAPGHWPHVRGPNLDGVSPETGLLREWPPEGPRLLWRISGLGDGIPPVTVAGGLIFALGYREGQEFASAFDGDGRLVWTQPIGPASGEVRVMRFLNQRGMTVDGDRVYPFSAAGTLTCLSSADGRPLWSLDYRKDLGGQWSGFGVTDTPVVDGPRLLCMPGGSRGGLMAVDKLSGRTLWRCEPMKERAENAGLVVAEIGGRRIAIALTMGRLWGVEAESGRLLWSAERLSRTAINDPPIVHGSRVFVCSGFGVGATGFEISDGGARETYATKSLSPNHGNVVRVGGHAYARDDRAMKCVDLNSGEAVWSDTSVTMATIACADGLIVARTYKGELVLIEANPAAYRELARFKPPELAGLPQDAMWTFPVIAGGRLYVRALDTLLCYDLRGPDYRGPESPWRISFRPRISPKDPALGRGPDAAFVATPPDVVDRMLREAALKPGETLVDLGSGDGRIVIAAARDYRARARGVEIHPELVRLSRERIRAAGIDAAVVEGDLFDAAVADADVVTLYLGEPNNARLLPRLRALKPGSRVVSHAHLLGANGPKPDRTVKMTSAEDGVEREIHVWTLPFRE